MPKGAATRRKKKNLSRQNYPDFFLFNVHCQILSHQHFITHSITVQRHTVSYEIWEHDQIIPKVMSHTGYCWGIQHFYFCQKVIIPTCVDTPFPLRENFSCPLWKGYKGGWDILAGNYWETPAWREAGWSVETWAENRCKHQVEQRLWDGWQVFRSLQCVPSHTVSSGEERENLNICTLRQADISNARGDHQGPEANERCNKSLVESRVPPSVWLVLS